MERTATIFAAMSMNWIACKDQMPIERDKVLFLAFDTDVKIGYLMERDWNANLFDREFYAVCSVDFYKVNDEVNYWMPLPEAPKP